MFVLEVASAEALVSSERWCNKGFFGGRRWLAVPEPLGHVPAREFQSRGPSELEICSGRQPTETSVVSGDGRGGLTTQLPWLSLGSWLSGGHFFSFQADARVRAVVEVFGHFVGGYKDEEEFHANLICWERFQYFFFLVCYFFG